MLCKLIGLWWRRDMKGNFALRWGEMTPFDLPDEKRILQNFERIPVLAWTCWTNSHHGDSWRGGAHNDQEYDNVNVDCESHNYISSRQEYTQYKTVTLLQSITLFYCFRKYVSEISNSINCSIFLDWDTRQVANSRFCLHYLRSFTCLPAY